MNDIVERLQRRALVLSDTAQIRSQFPEWLRKELEAAADDANDAIAEIQRLRGVVAAVEREVATLDKHGPGPHSCCHAYGDDIAEDIRSVMQAALTKPGAGGEGGVRATRKRAAPGQLRMFHGRLPGDSAPDTIFSWGDGCSKRDGALLNAILGSERPPALPGRPWEPSLLDELKARGYDLSTLEFSIRKLPNPAALGGDDGSY